ncbi:MAG: N4-gp56 family major capsid protein [Pseudomonadota bacterium]
MTLATYSSPAQRIGRIKGTILRHAVHKSTLEMSGEVYPQPVKSGDTVIFRQVVPFGATAAAPNTFTTTAAAHLIQEGFTPPAESISVLDTTVQVQKYGALYGYTERQKALGEDDVPAWMEEQLGERLGLVRELIYIGAVQGGTNRFYSGGTTRATTALPVTKNLVDRVTRNLAANHSTFIKKILPPSEKVGTGAIQAAYLAFGSTDLQQDIEAIPGYIAKKDYGTMTAAHEMEIGAVGSVRFILSPDMPKIIDSGAAIAGTTNLSTTGTLADVYQLFVMAKDAWGHTKFRGMDAFNYNHVPVNKVDKSDPTGERGYCSATFYDAGVVTNHGWLAVCEVTVSVLT